MTPWMRKGELKCLMPKRKFKKSTVHLNFEIFCNSFFLGLKEIYRKFIKSTFLCQFNA